MLPKKPIAIFSQPLDIAHENIPMKPPALNISVLKSALTNQRIPLLQRMDAFERRLPPSPSGNIFRSAFTRDGHPINRNHFPKRDEFITQRRHIFTRRILPELMVNLSRLMDHRPDLHENVLAVTKSKGIFCDCLFADHPVTGIVASYVCFVRIPEQGQRDQALDALTESWTPANPMPGRNSLLLAGILDAVLDQGLFREYYRGWEIDGYGAFHVEVQEKRRKSRDYEHLWSLMLPMLVMMLKANLLGELGHDLSEIGNLARELFRQYPDLIELDPDNPQIVRTVARIQGLISQWNELNL